MFLSGLQSIDFSGLSGLGSDMARASLFSSFRNALTPGLIYSASDDEINSILDNVLSSYRITNDPVNLDDATIQSVSDGISSIVKNILGQAKAGAYYFQINGVVNDLKKSGFQAVPKGYVTPAAPQTPSPTYTPPVSGGSSAPSRASVIQYQASQATPQASSDLATQVSNGIQSFLAPITGRQQLPTIYRKVPYRQTPADRTRLMWILGGFGVLFAVAIGVIAGRD